MECHGNLVRVRSKTRHGDHVLIRRLGLRPMERLLCVLHLIPWGIAIMILLQRIVAVGCEWIQIEHVQQLVQYCPCKKSCSLTGTVFHPWIFFPSHGLIAFRPGDWHNYRS